MTLRSGAERFCRPAQKGLYKDLESDPTPVRPQAFKKKNVYSFNLSCLPSTIKSVPSGLLMMIMPLLAIIEKKCHF